MKVRYVFRFRTLSDPAELYEVTAGPFAPAEAVAFAATSRAKLERATGRTWVFDHSAAVEGIPYSWLAVFALGLVLVGIIGTCAFLQHHADAICHARAADPSNITLCRGETYALNTLGVIECGCRESE